MAIKRTSKSRGSPVRKPVPSSGGVRHVEIRGPQHMVPGDLYVGWLCKSKACGLVLALADAQPGSKPTTADSDQLAVIKCPHCGNEDLYRWGARSEHNYTPRSA